MTVPAVTTTGIARITTFLSPGLFGSFGLPQEYRAAAAGPVPAQDQAVPVAPLSRGPELLGSTVSYAVGGAEMARGDSPVSGWSISVGRQTSGAGIHRTRENRHVGT